MIAPTALYPSAVSKIKQKMALMSDSNKILGMAHITGGGFTENIPRVLPDGLGVKINLGTWNMHPIFPWLQEVVLHLNSLQAIVVCFFAKSLHLHHEYFAFFCLFYRS